MNQPDNLKLLFVINPGSGNNSTDWATEISNYFAPLSHTVELYHLTKGDNLQTIKEKIKLFLPQRVVAVGGDGTVKLVAECLMQTNLALGILPAGSANGLAKELGIGNNPDQALAVLVEGHSIKTHVTLINNQLCIHLSDIGLNAYIVKEFEDQQVRGMWGYLKAFLKVLFKNELMDVEMQINKEALKIKAEMVVIANATQYGSGALINPVGRLDDELFEVIAVKKISFYETFKMIVSHEPYDPEKTEIFQTNKLSMKSRKKVHFQIDGEYLGKVKEINAVLIPNSLEIIIPAPPLA